MHLTKRVWVALAIIFVLSFGVLGYIGKEIYQVAPPIAKAYKVNGSDRIIFTDRDVIIGQQAWQSIGGHSTGTVWGHGAYLAPDWSADWLHREAVALLEIYAQDQYGKAYAALTIGEQGSLKPQLVLEFRTNTYDPETGIVSISPQRAQAIDQMTAYYSALFSDAPEFESLREQYAIRNNPLPDAELRRQLSAFYFWSAWAASTERPDDVITYTNNWPHEPLVENKPTSTLLIWSIFSVLALIAGVAALIWHHATREGFDDEDEPLPESDPLENVTITKSMRATYKYFVVVVLLFLAQIGMGILTAHYAVEGHEFYGFNLADYLPYAVTRTWHLQLSVFWIATAWLATGLYLAPMIGGKEPKFQLFGVNFLFYSLLAIVVGSMAGEWLGVMQYFSLWMNFWFGHQGWEFIELGRFWQIYLFIGLMLWVVLMGRGLWPAMSKPNASRQIVIMLFLSVVAIGSFYGAGLMWGTETHMSIVEYWRWWVIHLWVEGFFEVFATTAIAFLFVQLGMIRMSSATYAVIFATVIFLTGGIIGTSHHWYFVGTPTVTITLGSIFSALEVVPLCIIGFEAYEHYRHVKDEGWVQRYKWILIFFIGVAFWNLVGAGLLGFLINPPISLYYTQGLNTTPTHAHAAFFGVYGLLGIGLMLFALRGMANPKAWDDRLLKWGFWLLNIGLAMMVFLALLPAGIAQFIVAVDKGTYFARSAEFMHSDFMELMVWVRVPGDIIFAIGALFIIAFVFKLVLKRNA